MSYRIVFSLLKPRSQNTQCASFWSWYRFEVSLSGLTAVFGRKPRTRSDITHFRPLSFTLSKHCAKRQNTVGSLTFPAFKSYLVHKRGQGVCTRMLPHTRAREHYFQTYQILALMRSVTPINTSTWGQELLLHYLYTRFPFKTHCSTFSDHPTQLSRDVWLLWNSWLCGGWCEGLLPLFEQLAKLIALWILVLCRHW